MTNESLKNAVRRFHDCIDRQDWASAQEMAAPNIHVRVGSKDIDRDTWLAMGKMFAEAFPDGKHEFVDFVVEGDKVASRGVFRGTHKGSFQGIPASGKSIAVDMMLVDRIAEGRVVEHIVQFDAVGLLQQIGAMPGG